VTVEVQETEQYRNRLIHAAGFIEGIAARLESVPELWRNEMIMVTLAATVDDLRWYAGSLRKLVKLERAD